MCHVVLRGGDEHGAARFGARTLKHTASVLVEEPSALV